MKYRLFYHAHDYTSDYDSGISSYRHFYSKNDGSAKRKVQRVVKYTFDVECSIMIPLKLLKIIQRKTKHKEEITVEVPLN